MGLHSERMIEGVCSMKKKAYNVAIVGATGVVGTEILSILAERKFPVKELKLLASERSAGKKLTFKGVEHRVELLGEESFKGVDIGLFSPGSSVSAKFAPKAAKAGCVVIDNTSCFRMDPKVPLVVPEVNPGDVALYKKKGIIANPNCSTIQMVVALKPIHDAFGIKRVVVSTYQSVSGAGRGAMDELTEQVRMLFNMKSPVREVFDHQIAFNCLPQIDTFLDDGYTKEERKMVDETQKIFGDPKLRVSATAVRVPVYIGHSESINVETEKKITPAAVRRRTTIASACFRVAAACSKDRIGSVVRNTSIPVGQSTIPRRYEFTGPLAIPYHCTMLGVLLSY